MLVRQSVILYETIAAPPQVPPSDTGVAIAMGLGTATAHGLAMRAGADWVDDPASNLYLLVEAGETIARVEGALVQKYQDAPGPDCFYITCVYEEIHYSDVMSGVTVDDAKARALEILAEIEGE